MAFYIYENWQAGPHKAVIHHGSCGYCKEGKGRAGGYDPAHAEWHGPFSDLDEARRIQELMKVVERKECRCVRTFDRGLIDGVKIGSYEFQRVCNISPERAEDGSVLQFMPQERYENKKGLPLNKYGLGPFCKFKIPNNFIGCGVYAIVVDGIFKYLGECQNLSSRYNMGYGNISPRNCFVGGQETNCRINNLILKEAQHDRAISLWFMATEDYKALEEQLLATQVAEWNRI